MRWSAAIGTISVAALLAAPLGPSPTAGAAGGVPATATISTSAEEVQEQQWWLGVLGTEKIWADHTRGKGVVVAVIDDGVDPGGDLEGAVLPGFNQAGSGRGDNGSSDFHGTTMATEIAGRGTGQGVMGVAPEATILPVKIPEKISRDYTVQALRTLAAMDDPPEIVNMSYGGPGECSPDEQAAVREAVDAGMILVASVGNNHTGREPAGSPASCAGVIAVGAYGYFGELADRPDVRMWQKSEQQPYLALAAPGMRMIAFEPGSTQPVYFDGTSDAAAIASGSFALVRAAFPDMPSRELVARVLATARPLDDKVGVRSEQWGFGAVRPRPAIEEDVPSDAPNPVYDALDEAVPPTGGGSETEPSSPESGGASVEPDSGDPSDSSAAGESADESASALVVVVAVVVAVLLLVLVLVLSRRRRPASGGPGWPT
jgi:subtilisin family serine protease